MTTILVRSDLFCRYELSAIHYAETYSSFEEIALKFLQVWQIQALKTFLRKVSYNLFVLDYFMMFNFYNIMVLIFDTTTVPIFPYIIVIYVIFIIIKDFVLNKLERVPAFFSQFLLTVIKDSNYKH